METCDYIFVLDFFLFYSSTNTYISFVCFGGFACVIYGIIQWRHMIAFLFLFFSCFILQRIHTYDLFVLAGSQVWYIASFTVHMIPFEFLYFFYFIFQRIHIYDLFVLAGSQVRYMASFNGHMIWYAASFLMQALGTYSSKGFFFSIPFFHFFVPSTCTYITRVCIHKSWWLLSFVDSWVKSNILFY